jgi:hypothetical protein
MTLLENADTPEVLMAVVNIILHVAKNYNHVFSSMYECTVQDRQSQRQVRRDMDANEQERLSNLRHKHSVIN